MHRKMRNLILALLLLAMALSLAACGNKAKEVETPQQTRADTNEINVGIPQDLEDSLDPHVTTAAGTREVLFNVFEGLMKADPEGNIIPAVAEKCDVSDDAKVYTFTLREGVAFHNGQTVTVDDVVYSISRCAGMLDDGVYTAASTLKGIVSVEAPDDRTVVITLSEGNTEFLASLVTTYAAIIPADYTDQAANPVGTGPFKFASRSPQENFVIERFDDYWGTPAKLNKVTYLVTAMDTAVMSMKSGVIDVFAHLTADMAKSVEDQGEGVCFNVYVYNCQPGVVIDYATGESRLEERTGDEKEYVLNTSSKKFHLPSCSGAASIGEANRQDFSGSREELIQFLQTYLSKCDCLISREGPVDVNGMGDTMFGHFDEETALCQRKAGKWLIRVANMAGATAMCVPERGLGCGQLLLCQSVPGKIRKLLRAAEGMDEWKDDLIAWYFGNLDQYLVSVAFVPQI